MAWLQLIAAFLGGYSSRNSVTLLLQIVLVWLWPRISEVEPAQESHLERLNWEHHVLTLHEKQGTSCGMFRLQCYGGCIKWWHRYFKIWNILQYHAIGLSGMSAIQSQAARPALPMSSRTLESSSAEIFTEGPQWRLCKMSTRLPHHGCKHR